jgi:TetR/AcrR family transcriptional repressor of mexJK operon
LFLRKGYAGTTMEEIAALAGLTKRTVYNNYADKDALFTQILAEVISYAERFARGPREEFTVGITAGNQRAPLDDLCRRLALGIVRPEVVALRWLLIGTRGGRASGGSRTKT